MRVGELRGIIIHLDEVLTMSARMAAATGDLAWEERYRRFEPKLDAAIKESVKLAPEASSGEAAGMTDAANIRLVEMENRAFDLVRQGRADEAKKVLFSDEYEKQKQVYAQGMTDFDAVLSAVAVSSLARQQRGALLRLVGAVAVIPLLIAAWLIVFRFVRRWEAYVMDNNRQLSRQAEELSELNMVLDKSVEERTSDLEASRRDALNMMQDAEEARRNSERLNKDLRREISEHRLTEKALRSSERRFRRVIEKNADAILVIDGRGEIRFANSAAGGILKVDSDRLVGTQFGFPLAEGPSTEIHIANTNGAGRIAEMRVVEIEWEGESAYLASLRDTTDRHVADEALRESQEKYSSIINNVGIGIALISPEMEILELNERMREWFPHIDPGNRPICYRACNDPPRDAPCTYCPTIRTLQEGKVYEATTEDSQEGGTRHYRIVSSPIRDASGSVTAAIEIVEDTTEKHLLELQLRQSQKMEAIGQLAGGVAHDFNNILQVMESYTHLAMISVSPGDDCYENLAEIRKACERASSLTRQLLLFSRRQRPETTDFDLNSLIAGLAKMLRRVIGETVELELIAGKELGNLHADPGQMEQVLMNLCVNARDAMPEGGRIAVETQDVFADEAYRKSFPLAVEGRYVLLKVSDTGTGMPPEVCNHVFEPFFTTKEEGEGTGLGLATVYGIVKDHNGYIGVTSKVGEGTTFNIHFPVVARQETQVQEDMDETAYGGSETIMIAEDEDVVRKSTVRILEKAGYVVLVASNGEEALKLFESDKDRIDLVILDVVMPKLSGRIVHDRIREIEPGMPILFISGYSSNVIDDDFLRRRDVHLTLKPFRSDQLLRKLRELLEGSRAKEGQALATTLE